MRHLYGVALASATTLVMFFAGAWGYERLLRLPTAPGKLTALPAGGGSLLSNSGVLFSLAAVAGTAALVGVLVAVPRISPLAAGLPGLFLIGWTGFYLASVRRATELIPLRTYAFGAGWEALLFNGILGAVGLAMITPMFVPARWRKRRPEQSVLTEAEATEASDFLADLTGHAEPAAPAQTVKTAVLSPTAIRRPGPATASPRPQAWRRIQTSPRTEAW